MSQENVEIVQRIMVAQAQRDWEVVFSHYETDIEWDQSRNPTSIDLEPVSRGHEAVRTWFRGMTEAWDIYEYEQDELIDAGDHVVQVVRFRGQGRTSGVEVEDKFAQVWTVSDGLVARVQYFPGRAQALEAAGVSE